RASDLSPHRVRLGPPAVPTAAQAFFLARTPAIWHPDGRIPPRVYDRGRFFMVAVRRYVVLLAIMFWQGGFTFYSAVVVHVGNAVLGSHLDQGLVTRSVTNYLNLAGLVAIGLWGWDIAAANDLVRWRRRLRWSLWAVLVLTLGLLAWQHVRLDQ